MKRVVAGAAVGIGLVAAWLLLGPVDGAVMADAGLEQSAVIRLQPVVPVAAVRAEEPVADGVAEEAEGAWRGAVGAVREQCGLQLQTGCAGGRCVSLATVPMLDNPAGWWAMARRSPALVAAVVAGDLGLPDRALPCRDAVRGLGEVQTLARRRGEGELWCLVADPADAALCDALARELTGEAAGFGEGSERRVELRPPA